MTALLDKHENHLDLNEPRWFAVYTRFKREKTVTKELLSKGIETYLPLLHVSRHYTRKVKHVELPLINCYVFTKITKQSYVPVLETNDVVKFVKFSKNLISIPEAEIDLMRRVTGERIPIDVEERVAYQPGDEVEIVSGNLTGLKGKLLRTGKKNFLINLKYVGCALRMEVSPSILRKVK